MRKQRAKKRYLAPDPKFNDPMVTQFVNMLMFSGKKSTSFRIFYDALDILEEKKVGESGYDAFKKGLANIVPQVEVRSRRIGGATFQIPTQIRQERKLSLGMKWLILFSRKRSGKSMAQKLASELESAFKSEGAAVKKKEDTHRMAEANKAFAHFRV